MGVKKSNIEYINITKNLFNDIIIYAKNNDIKKMIIAGDFFEVRKHITIKCLSVAMEIGQLLSESFDDVYITIGNHDMELNSSMHPTSLSLFNKFNNIHIIDEPYQLENITLYPWLFNIDNLIDNTWDSDIVIGHFEMNGITLNACGTVSEGYNLKQSQFKDYKMVLSGHFHTPGEYGNITYLGSPFQTTFNDMGDQKGYYVLDTDDVTLEKIPFEKYPHHYIIKDTDKDTEMPLINGNIIKLVFTDDYGIEGNKKILDSIKDNNPYKIIVDYFRTDDSFTDEEGDVEIMNDRLEMLRGYYKKADLPSGIQYSILDKVVTKLYNEVME